jgi:hypothetical protein
MHATMPSSRALLLALAASLLVVAAQGAPDLTEAGAYTRSLFSST